MVAEGRGEGGGGFGIVRIRRANGSKPVTGRGLMRGGTTDLKIFLRHIPLPFFEEVDCSKSSSRECYEQEEARGG